MLEECDICGQSTGKVYTCRVCGARFCRYCGSFTEKICINCIEASGTDAVDAPEAAKPARIDEVSQ
jgi:hypothetical protein